MNFIPSTAPSLRRPVPEYDGDPRALSGRAELMFKAMKDGNGEEKNGLGLAAPQLGMRLRMFAMRSDSGNERYVCINPKVHFLRGRPKWKMEGCLTIPGKRIRVLRHEHIDAEWTDTNGAAHRREFQGWAARCFQHELDHLNGVVIWDGMTVAAIERMVAPERIVGLPRTYFAMAGDAQDGGE